MLIRIGFWCCMLLAACSGTGQAQVRLERKYTEGATYRTETASQVDQTLTIAGMEIKTTADTRVVSNGKVGNRDAAGTLRIQEKVEQLDVKITSAGSEYVFDSQKPDEKGASPLEILREAHKAMSQMATTVVVGKDNQIQAIELDQNVIAGLSVDLQQLVKSQIDPEYLKQAASQENNRLPDGPVSPGDTWVRTENVNFGAGQQMTSQNEYTYQGTVEQAGKTLDKITSKVLSLTFMIQDSPIPVTLKQTDLKPDGSEGTILFDRQQGRTVEAKTTMVVKGDLQFVQQDGKELPAKLDLKLVTTMTSR